MLVAHKHPGDRLTTLFSQLVVGYDKTAYLGVGERFANIENAIIGELVVAEVEVVHIFFRMLLKKLADL